MTLDARGIPGISVVTAEFRNALEAQSGALGFEPAVLFVPHPIQNRTVEELSKIADDIIEPALKMLTAGG
jgi:hypothetical protein